MIGILSPSVGAILAIFCILCGCYDVGAFTCERGRQFAPTHRIIHHHHRSKSSFLHALAQTEQNASVMGKGHRSSNKKQWILLVEDETDLRGAIGKYLAEEGGYHVTGVSDARSAMLVCRGIVKPNANRSRFKFDPKFNQNRNSVGSNSTNNSTQSYDGPGCIVLDIHLGTGKNGLELLKIIRSDPMLENLPVVLLTAKGKVEDRILGYEVGADAYLPKPFEPEELLSVVNGLLDRDTRLLTNGSVVGSSENEKANMMYKELKRELNEIQDLIQQLDGSPASSPADSSDLRSELVDIKEKITGLIDNSSPVAEINGSDQFVKLSLLASDEPNFFLLTSEEKQILDEVRQGLTNKEIASQMECSISKIEKRISALFNKAEVSNRAELVQWWKKSPLRETIKADEEYSQQGPVEDAKEELQGEPPRSDDTPNKTSLTAEEVAIMNLLERGLTTDEIISETQSTKGKVSKQLNELLKRSGSRNRTDLIRWWKRNR